MDDTPIILRRARWQTWLVGTVAAFASLFALVGFVGCIFAYRQVDAAEDATRARLRELSRTTAQGATSLRLSAATAKSAAVTVGTARDSLADVSRTVNDTATTMDEIAAAINFTIPFANTRPLAGVDERFRTQAAQLRTIATQLGDIQSALTRNAADVRRIGDETATLATQFDTLSRELSLYADEPNTGLPALARGIRFALVWICLLHLVLFAVSAALWALMREPHVHLHPHHQRGEPLASVVTSGSRVSADISRT